MTRPLTPEQAIARVVEWTKRLPWCKRGHCAIGKLPVDRDGVLTFDRCAWCEVANG